MKNKIYGHLKKTIVVIIGTFALMTTNSFAGLANYENVIIDVDQMWAHGDMRAARFSDNDNEYIGCGTRTYIYPDGSSYVWGFCQAGLEENNNYMCTIENNDDLIREINGLSSYSYITFRWNEAGECTYIGHSSQSFYIPGKQDK
ncbi:MAG: hypothetical protein OEY19_11990 [Gammaproteobacteria bacterium]|nr:hypothetical protein [Gammaproteobacteria bacterium]